MLEIVDIKEIKPSGGAGASLGLRYEVARVTIRNRGGSMCRSPRLRLGAYGESGDSLGKHTFWFPELDPGERASSVLELYNIQERAARARILSLQWEEEGRRRSVDVNQDVHVEAIDRPQPTLLGLPMKWVRAGSFALMVGSFFLLVLLNLTYGN